LHVLSGNVGRLNPLNAPVLGAFGGKPGSPVRRQFLEVHIMSRVANPVETFSVGSRVSWGAILAGVVVAFAVSFLLNLLGTAIGLSVINRSQPDTLNTGANIWAIVSIIISLFVGGWVTSRFTVGEDRLESLFNGAIVWGVSFLLMLWVVSVGLGMGYSSIVAASNQHVGADGGQVVVNADTAARAAWWAFVGTLLSMAAAIGGSLAGAATMHVNARRYEETGGRVFESPGKPTV
jgi:hypothetical protein